MEEEMPEVFSQLAETRMILEKHYRDMQDMSLQGPRGTSLCPDSEW